MNLETRNSKLSFFISAGEASGEAYGAQLIAALREFSPDATFFGLGSKRMAAAGFDSVVDSRDVAVLGLAEVVSHLPKIYGKFRTLLREIDARRPDAAILIDFPDFNFRLARQLHRRRIPVFYFVSPQLWAWRQGRIKLVRKYVRKMIVIFPFEEEFYRQHGVAVEYVGHPLADIPAPSPTYGNFASQAGLNPEKPWIALLPGSRRKEVEMNLPEMLRAAKLLGDQFEFVIPVAPTLCSRWLKKQVDALHPTSEPRVKLTHDAREALVLSRAAVVASGTATVEAALMGTPFVMVYRVSNLTWSFGRHLVKTPHYAMVNLIAGRQIVPELVQEDFTAERIVGEVRAILDDGSTGASMLCGLENVRRRLHPFAGADTTAASRAARAILRGLA